MKDLNLTVFDLDDALKLKVFNINSKDIENANRFGLTTSSASEHVALKILELDQSLIDQVKKLDIAQYDVMDFIRKRTNSRHMFRGDVNMYKHFERVIEKIHQL